MSASGVQSGTAKYAIKNSVRANQCNPGTFQDSPLGGRSPPAVAEPPLLAVDAADVAPLFFGGGVGANPMQERVAGLYVCFMIAPPMHDSVGGAARLHPAKPELFCEQILITGNAPTAARTW